LLQDIQLLEDRHQLNQTKILDYVTQQHKLLPQIANAYALRMAGSFMRQFKGILTSLPLLHATSAGLKAFSSEMACCGGIGYFLASSILSVYFLPKHMKEKTQ